MTEEQVVERFKAYLSHRMSEATQIEIRSVRPIVGGASRQTFGMTLNVQTQGTHSSRQVILRRELESGIIETRTRTEWEA